MATLRGLRAEFVKKKVYLSKIESLNRSGRSKDPVKECMSDEARNRVSTWLEKEAILP